MRDQRHPSCRCPQNRHAPRQRQSPDGPLAEDKSCSGSRPAPSTGAAVRPRDRRPGPPAATRLTWMPEGSPGLLPAPASCSASASASATMISKPRALRILPPAARTLGVPTTGNPDHDRLDVTGGDPAADGGTGVGQAGGGRCVRRDQGGNPGEHQLARRERTALEGRGGDVGGVPRTGAPALCSGFAAGWRGCTARRDGPLGPLVPRVDHVHGAGQRGNGDGRLAVIRAYLRAGTLPNSPECQDL